MKSIALEKPYGDKLINLIVSHERSLLLKETAINLKDIICDDRQLCDLELLASGAFSPLNGFMNRDDYESVLDRMRLQNDILWPIPICLSVNKLQVKSLEGGQSVCLRDQEGFLIAIMHIEDIWKIDKEKEAQKIFKTMDLKHQGVNYLFKEGRDFYIGGKIEVISLPLHFDFKQLRMTPFEIRNIYEKLGWHRIVGFKTRHPIHKAQYEITINAMRQAKANLLILSVAPKISLGDFDHYTRVRCYRSVVCNYPSDSYLLNLLPFALRMSGARDAILDMIIARNFGCTHFIIGKDHASPELNIKEKSFYEAYEARDIAKKYSNEIGVEIISCEEMVYLPFEDEYRSINQVPENIQTLSLSGFDIRKRIISGKNIPKWATFPEVIEQLQNAYPPPKMQGFTIFLTGLSGAGKSTIAKVLYSRFLEKGTRPVSLLDGDIVRQNLSSELSFSKEHRDINVRRIGFVASLITKNRGIAVCAPIAPYSETRNKIRKIIESYGGFIQVYVATPIDECEKRDRKGMYAKARAGLIKGFTGVDDPYEIPESSEIEIDTTNLTPDEAAQEIMLYLGQKGYI